jgi:hypothetical protein
MRWHHNDTVGSHCQDENIKSRIRRSRIAGTVHAPLFVLSGGEFMPIIRPQEKGKDNAQAWKDAPDERGEIPEGPAANNKNNAGKNKFEQEQMPVREPGD